MKIQVLILKTWYAYNLYLNSNEKLFYSNPYKSSLLGSEVINKRSV